MKSRSSSEVKYSSRSSLGAKEEEILDTGNPSIVIPSSSRIRKWNSSRYYDQMEIGNGTEGTIFFAIRKTDDTPLVIKKIDKNTIHNRIGQFPKEYVILNSLNHPNIAKVYGIEEDEEYFYIIMEAYKGGDLDSLLDTYDGEGMPPDLVLHIARQLVSALQYCHDRNISHRDLKLENIFIEDEEVEFPTVFIGDFGYSSIRPILDLLYDYPGSPPYASPELFSGIPHRGDKADVWALGVILYTLFMGEFPFYDQNRGKLVQKVMNSEVFPDIHNEDIAVPFDCRSLIKWMLTKDPSSRPSLEEITNHPCLR